MKKLRGENEITAVIPTSSMADIAFLLVVFFMVTTVFQVDKTDVKLPSSEIREEVPRESAFVVIHEDEDTGEMEYRFSNGIENSRLLTGLDGLYTEVVTMTSISTGYNFVLKADGYVAYEKIDDVIQLLRKAKAVNVILLTTQE